MKRTLWNRYVLLAGLLTVLGGLWGETLEVLRQIPHSGYSEGLHFHKNFLWHALPQAIVQIDPKDGTVVRTYQPATKYSESLVWVGETLWNVSFSDNGIYKGTLTRDGLSFKRAGSVPEVHAWGLEYDGKYLVVTGDYSDKLYFLDPKTLQVAKTLTVPIKDLEDLAWDGEGFWASSFTSHRGTIFHINPKNGSIGALYALPDPEKCPVIDGIAYDGKGLWLTGKHCASLYYVKRPVDRSLAVKSK